MESKSSSNHLSDSDATQVVSQLHFQGILLTPQSLVIGIHFNVSWKLLSTSVMNQCDVLSYWLGQIQNDPCMCD